MDVGLLVGEDVGFFVGIRVGLSVVVGADSGEEACCPVPSFPIDEPPLWFLGACGGNVGTDGGAGNE